MAAPMAGQLVGERAGERAAEKDPRMVARLVAQKVGLMVETKVVRMAVLRADQMVGIWAVVTAAETDSCWGDRWVVQTVDKMA